jgi:hypothetical protein
MRDAAVLVVVDGDALGAECALEEVEGGLGVLEGEAGKERL